tara:strand:- start:1074 stop:4529 length:3456 start_codon:yes stop_codon:yes gene_type:complete
MKVRKKPSKEMMINIENNIINFLFFLKDNFQVLNTDKDYQKLEKTIYLKLNHDLHTRNLYSKMYSEKEQEFIANLEKHIQGEKSKESLLEVQHKAKAKPEVKEEKDVRREKLKNIMYYFSDKTKKIKNEFYKFLENQIESQDEYIDRIYDNIYENIYEHQIENTGYLEEIDTSQTQIIVFNTLFELLHKGEQEDIKKERIKEEKLKIIQQFNFHYLERTLPALKEIFKYFPDEKLDEILLESIYEIDSDTLILGGGFQKQLKFYYEDIEKTFDLLTKIRHLSSSQRKEKFKEIRHPATPFFGTLVNTYLFQTSQVNLRRNDSNTDNFELLLKFIKKFEKLYDTSLNQSQFYDKLYWLLFCFYITNPRMQRILSDKQLDLNFYYTFYKEILPSFHAFAFQNYMDYPLHKEYESIKIRFEKNNPNDSIPTLMKSIINTFLWRKCTFFYDNSICELTEDPTKIENCKFNIEKAQKELREKNKFVHLFHSAIVEYFSQKYIASDKLVEFQNKFNTLKKLNVGGGLLKHFTNLFKKKRNERKQKEEPPRHNNEFQPESQPEFKSDYYDDIPISKKKDEVKSSVFVKPIYQNKLKKKIGNNKEFYFIEPKSWGNIIDDVLKNVRSNVRSVFTDSTDEREIAREVTKFIRTNNDTLLNEIYEEITHHFNLYLYYSLLNVSSEGNKCIDTLSCNVRRSEILKKYFPNLCDIHPLECESHSGRALIGEDIKLCENIEISEAIKYYQDYFFQKKKTYEENGEKQELKDFELLKTNLSLENVKDKEQTINLENQNDKNLTYNELMRTLKKYDSLIFPMRNKSRRVLQESIVDLFTDNDFIIAKIKYFYYAFYDNLNTDIIHKHSILPESTSIHEIISYDLDLDTFLNKYYIEMDSHDKAMKMASKHLNDFIDKVFENISNDLPRITYEDWIKDIHPDNFKNNELDKRFGILLCEHKILWNESLKDFSGSLLENKLFQEETLDSRTNYGMDINHVRIVILTIKLMIELIKKFHKDLYYDSYLSLELENLKKYFTSIEIETNFLNTQINQEILEPLTEKDIQEMILPKFQSSSKYIQFIKSIYDNVKDHRMLSEIFSRRENKSQLLNFRHTIYHLALNILLYALFPQNDYDVGAKTNTAYKPIIAFHKTKKKVIKKPIHNFRID